MGAADGEAICAHTFLMSYTLGVTELSFLLFLTRHITKARDVNSGSNFYDLDCHEASVHTYVGCMVSQDALLDMRMRFAQPIRPWISVGRPGYLRSVKYFVLLEVSPGSAAGEKNLLMMSPNVW